MLKTRDLIFVLGVLLSSTHAMAIEEAKYSVLLQESNIEIRQYDTHIVAETVIQGELEDAGNAAFSPLFDYISGNNVSQTDISMTAPVSQQAANQKIAMTAPVGQQQVDSGWAVSFMMPASYTLETLPTPNDPRIKLRQVPSQLIAAIRYSGFWSESNYIKHKTELENWLGQSDYKIAGEAIWARYNAPFTLWFLRRNEVLIPVVKTTPSSD